jgi:putative transposase
VIARGNQRQKVFLEGKDYARYLSLMGERLIKGNVVLYAYCLMPNHVHLLMEQKGHLPLSRTLQRLQTAYTKYFNKKYRKIGHLFQGRYKAILVDKDSYLLELVRYIHLNPKRAKLEERMGVFPWTSHAYYLGKSQGENHLVEVDAVLVMFDRKQKRAIQRYSKFVKEGEAHGHRADFYETSGWHVLGGEEFEFNSLAKIGQSSRENPLRIRMGVAEIWQKVKERHFCTEEPEGRKRSGMIEEAAYLATEGAKKTQREVGEYFEVDQAAISQSVKRIQEKWVKETSKMKDFLKWAKNL